MEIKKVWKKNDGSKVITIPRKSDIEAGDYVQIEKINKTDSTPTRKSEVEPDHLHDDTKTE